MSNSETSTSPASTNRQLQALEGTYTSSKQIDQQRKIREGTRKLLQRMPSENSEFSDGEDDQEKGKALFSCSSCSNSEILATRKMRKFERKALETIEDRDNSENHPRVMDIVRKSHIRRYI